MAEQNQDDETLEELEIRSASWYQK